MRGDLVSRPIGDVLSRSRGAVRVGRQGAARHQPGHQRLRRRRAYRTGFWDGRPVKTRMLELCERAGRDRRAVRRLGAAALRLSVSARRRRAAADGDAARSCRTSTCRSSTRTPTCCARMKRPASGEKNLERLARWREICPELVVRSTFIAGFPGETEAEFEHLLDFMREARDRPRRLLRLLAGRRRARQRARPACCRPKLREERRARFMAVAEEVSTAKLQRRVGATMQVLVDSAPALGRKGGVGRSYADAPEIDGTRAPAAAREGVEDAQGRRVHARPHRRRRRPRPGRDADLSAHRRR